MLNFLAGQGYSREIFKNRLLIDGVMLAEGTIVPIHV